MKRYIAFDVETPNCKNDSICSIGVTVVENGQIVAEHCDLVDPEDRFNEFNVRFHGIGPEQVRGKANFPTLWRELAPLMDSGVWIAHNAAFDLGVLKKLFVRYNIPWKPQKYACTVRMGRKCIPELPNHKLDTLCEYLHIPLNHHNATSDSRACAMLLCYYLKTGFPVSDYIREYKYEAKEL